MQEIPTTLLVHTLRMVLECVDESLALNPSETAKLEFKRVIQNKLDSLRACQQRTLVLEPEQSGNAEVPVMIP